MLRVSATLQGSLLAALWASALAPGEFSESFFLAGHRSRSQCSLPLADSRKNLGAVKGQPRLYRFGTGLEKCEYRFSLLLRASRRDALRQLRQSDIPFFTGKTLVFALAGNFLRSRRLQVRILSGVLSHFYRNLRP